MEIYSVLVHYSLHTQSTRQVPTFKSARVRNKVSAAALRVVYRSLYYKILYVQGFTRIM
jgi:hypothetical protein